MLIDRRESSMEKPFLKNLQVVLVRAENPVNIGQAARAMKNFGVEKLALVRSAFHRVPEAYTVGWKAKKILERAETFNALDDALRKTSLAVGFTARKGKRRGEPRPIHETIPQILETLRTRKVAFVFGNEKNGLSNAELRQCNLIAAIPVAKEYSSLNLSHAVAISVFTVFSRTQAAARLFDKAECDFATTEEFESLMQRWHLLLRSLGYQNSGKLNLLNAVSDHLRHYFKRTGIDRRDFHMFRALLSRIDQKLDCPRT